jgi:hypothetical protein
MIYTKKFSLDCLRDIGLDEMCYTVGTGGDCMTHTRWMYSMAGEEFARIFSWGNDPARKVLLILHYKPAVLMHHQPLSRTKENLTKDLG